MESLLRGLRVVVLVATAIRMYAGGDPERVSLVVTLSDHRVSLTGGILVEAQLRNMTDRPVSFWGELLWGYRGGLILHILREDGTEVPSRPLVDESITPSKLREVTAYVTIQSAHTFGVVRSDRVAALVDTPGTYRMFVEYLSPIPRNYANVQNLWSRQSGTIRSREVQLIVTR
jgi:hypothetical protein